MLLALDVGNTNITLGGFDGDQLLFVSRIATDRDKMEDQYAIEFRDILKLYGFEDPHFEGAIISSVVPSLYPVLKTAVERFAKCEALTISPGIKTGLNIRFQPPTGLGSDRVCGAVAAIAKYPTPCIIFDLGTATTLCAIDRNGDYLGGAILPGVRISLDALSQRTAQLPSISFEVPKNIIGRTTVESMKSGIVYGTASMMDGMVSRFREQLGEDTTVIATGGIAGMIVPCCREKIILDENLLLDGLRMIYYKNRS